MFFTFAKEEILQLDSLNKKDAMLWLTQMTSGVNAANQDNVKWGSLFPSRPLNVDSFKGDQLTAVYCLSKESDPKYGTLANKGNLLIACEGQEIAILSTLYFESLQYTKNIFHKVSSWEDLKEYVSPCTDVIIADQFIFSSPELYQKNIYSLIRALCSKVKNSHVNIVVFTLKSNYNKIKSTEFEPDWDTIYSRIRKCAEKYSSFNVTFVTASKQTLEEHDRTIFTNYKYFSSGDSYNYFDSNDAKITNGRYLHAHSHAEKDNESDAQRFLEDMQKIIDSIKSKNNSSLIKKDKVCNFLNFGEST
ncbi:MAG: hypothetical protein E7073_09310 [Bacteroidales bacterium]|jgi:hypothetical protein|nr:hypothetical protein [Bacteroidales bacterium]